MSNTRILSLAAGLAIGVLGCAGAPKPEARLASSEGAIRGAQEAGANQVPEATLELKLAQEQREHALALIKDGENHRAAFVLARSEADAELAVALAREASVKAGEVTSEEQVQELQKKAAQ